MGTNATLWGKNRRNKAIPCYDRNERPGIVRPGPEPSWRKVDCVRGTRWTGEPPAARLEAERRSRRGVLSRNSPAGRGSLLLAPRAAVWLQRGVCGTPRPWAGKRSPGAGHAPVICVDARPEDSLLALRRSKVPSACPHVLHVSNGQACDRR